MRKEKIGQLSKAQALNRAASLCSISEHCTSQIREKLMQWGLSAEDVEEILEHLVEEKFIDETRFARAYCHDKFLYNHWGRIKIGQMLRHMHLSEEHISEGMAVILEDDYMDALNEALCQKNRTLRDTDSYQRKGKLVRHLLSRGYEMDLVLDAVEAVLK